MTTYDHINELRAELAASFDQAERQQIAAELAAAEAKLAEEEAAFKALMCCASLMNWSPLAIRPRWMRGRVSPNTVFSRGSMALSKSLSRKPCVASTRRVPSW